MGQLRVLRRKIQVALFCTLLLAISGATFITVGCHKVTVTNAPPGVVPTEVAAWYQATGAVKTWSDASLALTNAAIDLHTSFPSEAAYQSTLQGLGKENQIGLQAAMFLQTVPQNFDATASGKLSGFLSQGLSALSDATAVGLLQIKNPQTQAAVTESITSLQTSLKIIFGLVNPAGTPVPAVLGGK